MVENLLYLQWNIKMFPQEVINKPFTILKYTKKAFRIRISSGLFNSRFDPNLVYLAYTVQPARNITEIQNTSARKKKCRVNYNQQNALIFSSYKVWVFPPFLVFGQATNQKRFLSSFSHILMTITTINYNNSFVTIFHTQRSTNLQTTFQNKK